MKFESLGDVVQNVQVPLRFPIGAGSLVTRFEFTVGVKKNFLWAKYARKLNKKKINDTW